MNARTSSALRSAVRVKQDYSCICIGSTVIYHEKTQCTHCIHTHKKLNYSQLSLQHNLIQKVTELASQIHASTQYWYIWIVKVIFLTCHYHDKKQNCCCYDNFPVI